MLKPQINLVSTELFFNMGPLKLSNIDRTLEIRLINGKIRQGLLKPNLHKELNTNPEGEYRGH